MLTCLEGKDRNIVKSFPLVADNYRLFNTFAESLSYLKTLDLFDFLKDLCKALEYGEFLAPVKQKLSALDNMSSSKTHSNSFITKQTGNQALPNSISNNKSSNFKCFLCKDKLAKFSLFLIKTVQDHHTFVKKNTLRLNLSL